MTSSQDVGVGSGPDVWLDQTPLLDWFEHNGRHLPWRETRDPWSVMVAELMLQQTQVGRVVERWPQFLDRFPTVTACALATTGGVIDAWSGLGYNRRAVALHRSAQQMVDRHAAQVPTALDDLLALPGIGPYTARAVRVFAHELDDGVVDTNVARILARVVGRSLKPAEVQRLASEAVPTDDGWRWNQALLDVGAAHCRARTPRCGGCPFTTRCRWYASGSIEPDPAVGSARVSSTQSRFEGSDRQGRGRLVAALCHGSVGEEDLAAVMGWPGDPVRARRIAASLVDDGLARIQGSRWMLP